MITNLDVNLKLVPILLVFIAQTTFSAEYGPSILSLIQPSSAPSTWPSFISDNEPIIENDEKEPVILPLEDFPNYAAVLPFAEGRPWVRSEEIVDILGKDSLSNVVPFIVTPPSRHGIMVVIQELRIPAYNTFNRSLLVIDDNGMIMECFSMFVFQIEGKSPVQVCGKTNDNEKLRPGVLDGLGPRSFIVPEGKSITVSFIYRDEAIDKSSSLSNQVPFYDFGYLLRASIAFTAYRDCSDGPPYYDELHRKLWPCDIPQSNREPVSACVQEDVFCDNVINCGIHNYHEFGIDERFCKAVDNKNNDTNSNSIQFDPTSSSFQRRRTILNPELLEDAIHSRIIYNNRPPSNGYYNNNPAHSSTRPRPELTGDYHFTTEAIDNDYTHPAFVTLVILISIICALIIALLFRFCCKRCVGRMNPYGNTSNPEALARFHENLRNRDHESSGRGNDYGISSDMLFKPPSDDLPPSYEDLFPQDILVNKGFVIDNEDHHRSSFPSSSSSSRSTPNSNSPNTNIVIVPVQRIPAASTTEYPVSRSIYTIPVVQQHQSTRENSSDNRFLNLNPSLIHVELLPEGQEENSRREIRNMEERRNSAAAALPIVNFIHNTNRRRSSNYDSHHSSNHNTSEHPNQQQNNK